MSITVLVAFTVIDSVVTGFQSVVAGDWLIRQRPKWRSLADTEMVAHCPSATGCAKRRDVSLQQSDKPSLDAVTLHAEELSKQADSVHSHNRNVSWITQLSRIHTRIKSIGHPLPGTVRLSLSI